MNWVTQNVLSLFHTKSNNTVFNIMFPVIMRFFLCSLLLFLTTLGFSQINENAQIKAGVIRVKFEPMVSNSLGSSNLFSSKDHYLSLGFRELDNANEICKIAKMKRVFPYAGKFEEKHRKYGLHLWYDLFYDASAPVEEILKIYTFRPRM